ncbi:unnamed protein product [Dovyalis caffra]|uniref:Uncharacterized protein n=1 Tax=Dovyalis caffra TaxID=77055 RepID=A0AAV1SRG4_9ROSI|nr:unnamed protein product [Dovyalis caffra]
MPMGFENPISFGILYALEKAGRVIGFWALQILYALAAKPISERDSSGRQLISYKNAAILRRARNFISINNSPNNCAK